MIPQTLAIVVSMSFGASRSLNVELEDGTTELNVGIYYLYGLLVQLPSDCTDAETGAGEDIQISQVGGEGRHNTIKIKPVNVKRGSKSSVNVICSAGTRILNLLLEQVTVEQATQVIQIVLDKNVSLREERLRQEEKRACEEKVMATKDGLREAYREEAQIMFGRDFLERFVTTSKYRAAIGDDISVGIKRGVIVGEHAHFVAEIRSMTSSNIEVDAAFLIDADTGERVRGKIFLPGGIVEGHSGRDSQVTFKGVQENRKFRSGRKFNIQLLFKGGATVTIKRIKF